MSPALLAGILSGITGLLTFLLIHAAWISPIWFILPVGSLIAGLGGLAVGWAYELLAPGLPAGPWRIPAFFGVITLILLPALVLPHFRSPVFIVTPTGFEQAVSTAKAVQLFILELVITAALAGGLAGWWVGGSRDAILRTALAGLFFALGPGHNIPLISGNWGAVFKSWGLLAAIIIVSTITLVTAEAYLRSLR